VKKTARRAGLHAWLGGLSVRSAVRALLSDDLGAELIEFALAIPILLGVVLAGIQFWEIMSLRAATRTATAQIARYIVAYGARARQEDPAPYTPRPAEDVCLGMQFILDRALAQYRARMAGAVSPPMLTWYLFADPANPAWGGNATPVLLSCEDFLAGLKCNQQFGVQVDVAVDWTVVFFGLKGSSSETRSFVMTERAVGAGPCAPYCKFKECRANKASEGPDGCEVDVEWVLDCSYLPSYLKVVVGDKEYIVPGPQLKRIRRITVEIPPDESTHIEVLAYTNNRVVDSCDAGDVPCGSPAVPTPTP